MTEPLEENRKKRKRAASSEERPSQKGRKLKQYVLEEKLDIIDYAKVIGNRAAGREFNVAESSIREWRKNEQRLRAMFETAPERSRLDGGGRRPVSEDLEKTLLLYVTSTADSESPLTWRAIKEKANDIWNKICESDADVKEKDFTANMGWVARFVKRNNIQIASPNSSTSSPESSHSAAVPAVNGREGSKTDTSPSPQPSDVFKVTEEKFSSKRKRKNFTPKKMVERSSIETNNILFETLTAKIAEPGDHSHSNGGAEPKSVDKEDEDENIDVCF